ncbi:MAG: hypothetical protein ACPLKQ_06990 [Candidatus Bathyarchaeales archaeon]
MSEVKGAIPKIIILILCLWLAIPSPIDIAVIISESIAKAIEPLNIEQANQIAQMYVIFFRAFGLVFFLVDIVLIFKDLKEGQFF